MKIKIISGVISLVLLGALGCTKHDMPRIITGTIIDTMTGSTINNAGFAVLQGTTVSSGLGPRPFLKGYVLMTDKAGYFHLAIEAKQGDGIGLYFLDSLFDPVNNPHYYNGNKKSIYKFTIGRDEEYHITIKTHKP